MSKRKNEIDKLTQIHYDIVDFRKKGDWIGLNEFLKPYVYEDENKSDVNELKMILNATRDIPIGAIISRRTILATRFNRLINKNS
jgi:hypothetical protein